MTWNQLIDAVNNLKTSWRYAVICYDDSIEIGIGKVDFIFKKELELFQEFTYYTDDDYEQHVSVYCGPLKDYDQMFELIKNINKACITLYKWKE